MLRKVNLMGFGRECYRGDVAGLNVPDFLCQHLLVHVTSREGQGFHLSRRGDEQRETIGEAICEGEPDFRVC